MCKHFNFQMPTDYHYLMFLLTRKTTKLFIHYNDPRNSLIRELAITKNATNLICTAIITDYISRNEINKPQMTAEFPTPIKPSPLLHVKLWHHNALSLCSSQILLSCKVGSFSSDVNWGVSCMASFGFMADEGLI